jgi:hypothetical protein
MPDLPDVLRDRRLARGYGPKPLPDPLDDLISTAIEDVTTQTGFEDALSAIAQFGTAEVVNAFAARMASLAVREESVSTLRIGIRALAMAASLIRDYREVLPVAALLYRACSLIGAVPAEEFSDAASLGDERATRLLRRFLERPDLERVVQAMGYIESSDADGFRFVRTW